MELHGTFLPDKPNKFIIACARAGSSLRSVTKGFASLPVNGNGLYRAMRLNKR
jgi:hypothetical protein